MNGLEVYPAKRLNAMVDGSAGKGDKYRKVDQEKWDEGWEAAFGKKKKKSNAGPTYPPFGGKKKTTKESLDNE